MQYIRTAEKLKQSVKLGETEESCYLEFKSSVNGFGATNNKVKKEGQLEACRDISQFANTSGGCLLIGIPEDTEQGRRVAKDFVNVPEVDALKQWLQQAMDHHLIPANFGVELNTLNIDGKSLLAVNIPPCERLVFVWSRPKIECYRRNSHGKCAMSPEEIEGSMMNSERSAYLRVNRLWNELKDSAVVDLADGIWSYPDSIDGGINCETQGIYLTKVNEYDFSLTVTIADSSFVLVVPYVLLRAAWITSDRHMGLILDARVRRDGNRLVLIPFTFNMQ